MTPQEMRETLKQLFKLMRDAGLDFGGCGCCESPWLSWQNEGRSHHSDGIFVPSPEEEDKVIEDVLKDFKLLPRKTKPPEPPKSEEEIMREFDDLVDKIGKKDGDR